MANPTAAQCHTLVDFFVKRYNEAKGFKPALNRNKARWEFDSILRDMSVSEAKDLVDYFIDNFDQEPRWFFNNYDRVMSHRQEAEKQKERVAAIMSATRARTLEWKQRGKETFTELED